MLEPAEKLIAEYRMLPPGTRVLCALSGGADSVCLMHLLYRLRRRLDIQVAAAHYNHCLRGAESDRDEQFVREFVSQCCGPDRHPGPLGVAQPLPEVELTVGRGDVAAQAARTGQGIEETARQMRYDFLQQAARELDCTVIATAHNADDNAETVLLHLMRGTGLRGLGGIPPARDNIVRPLLTTTRQEIEDYLRTQGLPWVEDSTNRSDQYLRNRVRHQVIPALRQAAPGFDRRLIGFSSAVRSDEAYLEQLAEQALVGLRQKDGRLTCPAAAVAGQADPIALRCTRLLMTRARNGDSRCTAAHLRALVGLCRSDDPSARIDLPGGLLVRREYGLLVLEKSPPAPPGTAEAALSLPGETDWGGWRIACTRETYAGQPCGPRDFWLDGGLTALTVRPRRTGDTLAPPGRHEKSLKRWFIDEKVPAHRREQIPVLAAGRAAAAVCGLGPDRRHVPGAGAPAWHITLTERQSPSPSGAGENKSHTRK